MKLLTTLAIVFQNSTVSGAFPPLLTPSSEFLWGLFLFCLPCGCGSKSGSLCRKRKSSHGARCSPAFCPWSSGSSWHCPPCLSLILPPVHLLTIYWCAVVLHSLGEDWPSTTLRQAPCCCRSRLHSVSAGDSYRNRALPLYNLVVHLQGKVEELEADLRQRFRIQDRTNYWGSRWEGMTRKIREGFSEGRWIRQIEKDVMISSKMQKAWLSREIATKKGKLLKLGWRVWGMWESTAKVEGKSRGRWGWKERLWPDHNGLMFYRTGSGEFLGDLSRDSFWYW